MNVREMQPADLREVAALYNHYARLPYCNFATEDITPAAWAERLTRLGEEYPHLSLVDGTRVMGFAVSRGFSKLGAYRWTVETAVYVAPQVAGQGHGKRLYGKLLEELTSRGYRVALGLIVTGNVASIKLHERCGFCRMGLVPRMGYKLGAWRDVEFWVRYLGEGGAPPMT